MKVLFLSVICVILYTFIVWLTTRKVQEKKINPRKWVLQASLQTLYVLWPVLLINRFWFLFVAVLVLIVATYLGLQDSLLGRLSRTGMYGAVLLSIPLYVYLLPGT